jgi:hypothetical protein
MFRADVGRVSNVCDDSAPPETASAHSPANRRMLSLKK